MSSRTSSLKPPPRIDDDFSDTAGAEEIPAGGSRTPRPYHRDGAEIRGGSEHGRRERGARRSALADEPGRDGRRGGSSAERSGQSSLTGSESGTEADDERPVFVRALPAPHLRPRKGLKTGEQSEDVLLTPSQLDDEGRRLEGVGYFKAKEEGRAQREDEREEQDKLLKRRLGEFVRRVSEVGLMAVMVACVLCGRGVLRTATLWRRELLSHVAVMVILVLAYPLKLSIVDTQAQHIKLWHRFRVPASFDPATVLYPPLLPVLVALSVASGTPAVILPNIILGLSALPQRLFPRSSRLGGYNEVHWLTSIVPLILSEHPAILPFCGPCESYYSKVGSGQGLNAETLVSLYALHHALLVPLHYLTTTSLLISELHLLSVALINLLFFAASPQIVILKACLWIGGVGLFVCCGSVLHWNVTLARVPKWKLRRPGHTAEERKSLVDAVTELINLQRASAAFRGNDHEDSDADEDEPRMSIKEKANGVPKLMTRVTSPCLTAVGSDAEPKSAIEPRAISPPNGFANGEVKQSPTRPRRSTLPTRRLGTPVAKRDASTRRKPRAKLLWCLQLTPQQAARRKWLYAAWVYASVVVVALGVVRDYVQRKALHGLEPFGWAVGYLFGQIPLVRSLIDELGMESWAALPSPLGDWSAIRFETPLAVEAMRATLGPANVRILLFGYWIAVIACGILVVSTLTAVVEVDTRRKVFHGVMVAVLIPTVFIDPCYCALGLALGLAVFLLLEVIRAGQVPPLGNAIGRFVAPYVDGRDLRGPVVVSHIFLLIGCAVPLWFSLASIDRDGSRPWIDWELAGNVREIAMIAGVVCVGMGDAAASLVGRRYGRNKWIWVGGKSLEGSAAFAAAVTVGLIAGKGWQVLGSWNDTVKPLDGHTGHAGTLAFVIAWTVSLVKAIFCACGASFMEAVLTGANDNVVVPVALWLLVKGTRL